MEKPCYKCGQVVEEGRPFCPHCGAPLIRVIVAEPVAVASGVAGASAGVRDTSDFHSSETVPVLALPVRWSNAFKPSFLAALVALGLMMLRLYPFVAILSAGFLAVLFYRQGRQNLPVTPLSGAKLGALAGFFCFCVIALVSAIGAAIPEIRVQMQAQIAENFQKIAAARPPDPQVQQLLDAVKSPEGFVMMLIVGAILMLVISLILGLMGGAVGGKIFQARDRS